MAEDQNIERRPASEPLEEHGAVSDFFIAAGAGTAANLAAPAVKAGASKLLGKVKQDKN